MMGGGGAGQKMPGQSQDFSKLFTTERGFIGNFAYKGFFVLKRISN